MNFWLGSIKNFCNRRGIFFLSSSSIIISGSGHMPNSVMDCCMLYLGFFIQFLYFLFSHSFGSELGSCLMLDSNRVCRAYWNWKWCSKRDQSRQNLDVFTQVVWRSITWSENTYKFCLDWFLLQDCFQLRYALCALFEPNVDKEPDSESKEWLNTKYKNWM